MPSGGVHPWGREKDKKTRMVIDSALVNALGFGATVLSILMWIPQASSTWKNRNDPMRLAAISETTQWLLMACYLLWGVFGVISASLWVAAPSVVAFPLALATVVIVRRGRRLPTAIRTVQILSTADALSVGLNTQPIPIISTQPIPIISSEWGTETTEPARDSFTSTGIIPILA